MKVNFSDFTNRREVHDYLIENSRKRVVKVESRLMDEDGVVVEHSDDFLENCGDIKYYFEDDESLEINQLNSVALFVRGNGQKLIVDYVDNNDFEPEFISLVNSELGVDFKVDVHEFSTKITGDLTGDQLVKVKNRLNDLSKEFNLKIVLE